MVELGLNYKVAMRQQKGKDSCITGKSGLIVYFYVDI